VRPGDVAGAAVAGGRDLDLRLIPVRGGVHDQGAGVTADVEQQIVVARGGGLRDGVLVLVRVVGVLMRVPCVLVVSVLVVSVLVVSVLVDVSGVLVADRVVHRNSSSAVARAPGRGRGQLSGELRWANCGGPNYAVVNPECGTPR
jgi:hypothetical protein